jgi:hypothetical protein
MCCAKYNENGPLERDRATGLLRHGMVSDLSHIAVAMFTIIASGG